MDVDKMTDYVFTYVDGEDDKWYKNFVIESKKAGRSADRKGVRYRSWGTLKYLLRGIAENLPFINNLYMVVEQESQVPEWVNRETVHVITHDMIIPKEFLPTYNSNAIETFMYKIPGLCEQFIYGNDDMFPIGLLKEEDFFKDGQPLVACHSKVRPAKMTIYRKSLVRTLELCKKHNEFYLSSGRYVRSDHSLNPMLKSTWEMYHNLYGKDIRRTITTFRKENNITQELSNFHHFIYNEKNGIKIPKIRKITYFEFKHASAERLRSRVNNPETQILCMNDGGVVDYESSKKIVLDIFEKRFPNKCKYEK